MITIKGQKWYRVKELSKDTHIPINTLYSWIHQGHLPSIKIGHNYFIRKEILEGFFEK